MMKRESWSEIAAKCENTVWTVVERTAATFAAKHGAGPDDRSLIESEFGYFVRYVHVQCLLHLERKGEPDAGALRAAWLQRMEERASEMLDGLSKKYVRHFGEYETIRPGEVVQSLIAAEHMLVERLRRICEAPGDQAFDASAKYSGELAVRTVAKVVGLFDIYGELNKGP